MIVVVLDAMGLGLIMPVLPTLLRSFVPGDQVAAHYGVLLALYALMQVVFAPVLGRMSDRYGRRPVLMVSLAGAALDYAVMASAPMLWVLYVGRSISGITGATAAVAASTVADVTAPSARVRWFGYIGAGFGAGMIAGPALGGLLAGHSAHTPFAAAAALNGVGLVLAGCLLRETRQAHREGRGRRAVRTVRAGERVRVLAGFRVGGAFRGMAGLIGVFFVVQFISQVPGALWVVYGEDRFCWDTTRVGVSLAVFGAVHALFQAVLAGPLSVRLGERRTLLLGMAADALGFVMLAFATTGWMVFPVLLLLAAGGVGMPALQAMLSRGVDEAAQGELQGVLTSLTNASGIVGPLCFTALYSATRLVWPGWAWMTGAVLYAVCVPVVYRCTATRHRPEGGSRGR
ncbi:MULTISPECIES: Tet(A)/Tet(B)/Tet(C) family tetracycline efflux MFS transporter [Pandoraea]|uniref:Tet(A)/Tet(B)/Tet(C) family tetracycline efflux MFS transporter n=1 Tax=Pandoraea sp. LA3 TaxID=2094120 RepID=UPI001F5C0F3C|nr:MULTISPECIES: Tet(A)/Tet(B)/Tet(C) family tetracycline efflux MFS transporter [Pandoraea]